MTRHYAKPAVRSVAGEISSGATHSAEMAAKPAVEPTDGEEDCEGTENADWHLPTLDDGCPDQIDSMVDMLYDRIADLEVTILGLGVQMAELEDGLRHANVLAVAAFCVAAMAVVLAIVAVSL